MFQLIVMQQGTEKVMIQLIVTPHILGKVQGQIKEVWQLIEPCLLIGTREYASEFECV